MSILDRDLVVARVLAEDDESMTVELIKDSTQRFDSSEKCYAVVFIREKDETLQTWKPWEN